MTKKNISLDGLAMYLLATASLESLATTHGFEFKKASNNYWIRPNSLLANPTNTGIRSFRYPSKENSPTTMYGKSKGMDASEFKDINIDDVLLEAQNALDAAQSSLTDTAANKEATTNTKTEFKDINIDDVLLEAESALNAAQTSLGEEISNTKTMEGDLGNFKTALRDSLLSDDKEGKASIEAIEIVSSTLGGILFGSLLGSVVTFQLTDIGLLDFGAETVSSVFAFMILGGITAFGGSMQENSVGFVVRKVLGVPARALASGIVGSIQNGIRRQVEKTTQNIKSIPSNVANSAKDAAVQKAREAKLSVDAAIEVLFEKLKQVALVAAVLASLILVGLYSTNGQVDLPPIDLSTLLEFPLLDSISQ